MRDMGIIAKLHSEPWFKRLGMRTQGFELAVSHFDRVAKKGLTNIIETGTARVKDNWEGDGQSTLIWDWLAGEIDGVRVWSIDRSSNGIDVAKKQTTHVTYLHDDSVEALRDMPLEILTHVGLLYLDSLDLQRDTMYLAPLHILEELQAVWDYLPAGCMIMVDDCHSRAIGKHAAIREWLLAQEIQPVLEAHQWAWIKP